MQKWLVESLILQIVLALGKLIFILFLKKSNLINSI